MVLFYTLILQIPYNIERMLYFATNCDTSKVKTIMEEFEAKDGVKMPDEVMVKIREAIKGQS